MLKSLNKVIMLILVGLVICIITAAGLFVYKFKYFSNNTSNEIILIPSDIKESEWTTNTTIELFKVTSINGEVIINGAGNGIIAPGTSNKCEFNLKNASASVANVEMNVSASLKTTIDDLVLPIKVRMTDDEGNYLLGNETTYVDFLELNNVSQELDLKKYKSFKYTIDWVWPFESDSDEMDTIIGNLADNNSIVLSVNIKTYADIIMVLPSENKFVLPYVIIGAILATSIAVCVLAIVELIKTSKKMK